MSNVQNPRNKAQEDIHSCIPWTLVFGHWILFLCLVPSKELLMKRNLILFALTCYCFACNSHDQNGSVQKADTGGNKPIVINPASAIPEYRKEIKAEAVDSFSEKTDNPLNDWYFSVKLFETPKTFQYLIKMKFEELSAEDILRLPDFGIQPKPVLKKGNDKYSCIIGFMDTDNKFREYKLVHVENGNQLKITTLKHYSVATYRDK
jgi:hypothetical protein